MRRLCVILLCGLVAVPAAMAASRATGDGVLEVFHAYGAVTVTGTRGTAWGQLGKGQMIVTDYVAGDGQVLVSGADSVVPAGSNVTIYSGKDIHFRVTGGRYRIRFTGDDINLSAVGVGTANPAFRRVRTSGGTRPRTASLSTRLVDKPRTLNRPGTRKANSTSLGSSIGTRASRPHAMVALSIFSR